MYLLIDFSRFKINTKNNLTLNVYNKLRNASILSKTIVDC